MKAIFANIVFLLTCYSTFSQKSDSLEAVLLSDKLRTGEDKNIYLEKMEHVFFDVDAEKIYYGLQLSGINNLPVSAFVFVEIKKKTNQQFRLKPLYTKKIALSTINGMTHIDSLLLSEVRLASGNFELIVNLMTDSSKVLHQQKASFQLLRSGSNKIIDEYYEEQVNKDNQIVDIGKSFVAKYDLPAITRNISSLQPIAIGMEQKVIRDLATTDDLGFLKQFFYNFWYNRNSTDPEAAWKEYIVKLNTVAKLYGTATMPGYETDRGRIYIQYGEPDKLEKLPAEKDALPYEIWFYPRVNNKSHVCFLFYQPGILGTQMFLLHSTEENEVINPYWKQQLLLDPDNPDNRLIHRVFEYFK